MKQWTIFAYVLLAAAVAFGVFVWPTPYETRGGIQINRFTGQVHRLKLPAKSEP